MRSVLGYVHTLVFVYSGVWVLGQLCIKVSFGYVCVLVIMVFRRLGILMFRYLVMFVFGCLAFWVYGYLRMWAFWNMSILIFGCVGIWVGIWVWVLRF